LQNEENKTKHRKNTQVKNKRKHIVFVNYYIQKGSNAFAKEPFIFFDEVENARP
jgi:hypothetical protein